MVPDCPSVFFSLAIECCRTDPDRRQAVSSALVLYRTNYKPCTKVVMKRWWNYDFIWTIPILRNKAVTKLSTDHGLKLFCQHSFFHASLAVLVKFSNPKLCLNILLTEMGACGNYNSAMVKITAETINWLFDYSYYLIF